MKGKVFIFVGRLAVPKKIVYEIVNAEYEHAKCWFVYKEQHIKSRFSFAKATGKKVEAILIGPIPHKTFCAGAAASMISEVRIETAVVPVYPCRTKSGVLKLTKTSIQQSIVNHKSAIEEKRKQEKEKKLALGKLITMLLQRSM
ncbi:MAG: hypothetical protein WC875_00135 [Candidatus Absconditabacterales bacterium]|jgi:hypothetical protein